MSCKVLLLRQLVSSQRMFITKYLAIVKLKNIFIFRKDKYFYMFLSPSIILTNYFQYLNFTASKLFDLFLLFDIIWGGGVSALIAKLFHSLCIQPNICICTVQHKMAAATPLCLF